MENSYNETAMCLGWFSLLIYMSHDVALLGRKRKKKIDLCPLAITLKLKSIPGSAWLL